MKKILIVSDGNHFSKGAFDFLIRLNEQQPVLAVGVFLPAIDYGELLYSIGGLTGPYYYEDVKYEDTTITEKNIERFKTTCISNHIEYRVHADMEKHVIKEIEQECRYADILIIGNELFYENLGADTQNDYLEKTLTKAECPVIVVPEQLEFPQNIILTYDGSKNSVFAIKQFAYLFPEFADMNTLLVYVGIDEIPDLTYIEEFASRHFANLTIMKVDIDPKKYFNTWIMEHGKSMLVTGAYGRSAFSELLKKSFVKDVLRDHKIPVFITHR